MTVKLTVTYDGTDFCGWQIQPNAITVQQVIEDALFTVTGKRIKVQGSGRTDAGVHARGQVAHFVTEQENIPAEKFSRALNVHLPANVKIVKSERAEDGFDACRNAKKKTYSYSLYYAQSELPLKERYAVKLDRHPYLELMKNAAKLFVGEHDFKCFCASGSSVKTTVRTIYSIDIQEIGQDIIISVCGNGFLYNMVRILVGALLDAGYGKLTEPQIKEMFELKNRSLFGKTLPAKGLCLERVDYE